MKLFVHLVCFGLLTATLAAEANAQILTDREPAGYAQGSAAPFSANLPVLAPGRFWTEVNLADNGFGYSGSYATLGGKTRLFQDYFDGRWLVEGQVHVALQDGGLFGNLGIERVVTIDSIGVDVSLGVAYDRDSSGPANFNHTLDQISLSAALKGKEADALFNAYFPVGTSNFTLGDPTGVNCFLNHSIVLQAGVDSALKGIDFALRTRPQALSMWAATFDIGGYSYESDLVPNFTGVRSRFGFQALRGTRMSVEANYDERFDFTGVVQLALFYEARGAAHEYAGTGRDLEKSARRDHIARFNQDLVLAINPATGAPYNVFHVDNSLAAAGIGTAEFAFNTLKAAEAAAGRNDIIFVREGDGTVNGMDQGIVLKRGQYLLGDGVQHILTDANRGAFILCNDLDGNLPRITNRNGNAVDLATNNTVRGFIIDGTGSALVHGIAGNNFTNTTIEDVTIIGSPILDGINIGNADGILRFNRNNISTAGRHGINLNAFSGTDLIFNGNNVSQNSIDGIHITNYDGDRFVFNINATNNNTRHGVFMDNYLDGNGLGGDFDFIRHTAISNSGDGIFVSNADGDILFEDSTIINNSGFGIHLVDFTNNQPGTATVITSGAGNSSINGNGVGSTAGVGIFLNAGTQRVRINDTQLNNNGIGVLIRAANFGTTMTSQIVNNVSISGNVNDGVRLVSADGATHTAVVSQAGAALNIAGNGGNGIGLIVEDGGVNNSTLVATLDNLNIAGSGVNGIFGLVDQNGQLTLRNSNNTITGSGGDGMFMRIDSNNTLLNSIVNNNITITGSGGNGVQYDLDGTSRTDIQYLSSSWTGSGADGMNVRADEETITRIFNIGVNGSGSGGDGVDVVTDGNAQLLARIDGSTFTGNGGTGITMTASGTAPDGSIISARIANNSVTGNTGVNGVFDTVGTGQMDALVTGNAFGSFTSTNDTLGRICMALSTNLFATPAVLTNNGAPVDFVVELDGTSNGLGGVTFVPNQAAFTIAPFGSTCEPNIVAQEAVFSFEGFPPLP